MASTVMEYIHGLLILSMFSSFKCFISWLCGMGFAELGGMYACFEAILCNKVSELMPRWTDTVRYTWLHRVTVG